MCGPHLPAVPASTDNNLLDRWALSARDAKITPWYLYHKRPAKLQASKVTRPLVENTASHRSLSLLVGVTLAIADHVDQWCPALPAIAAISRTGAALQASGWSVVSLVNRQSGACWPRL